MLIHQQVPPLDKNDGLYLVTLRTSSIIFPWDIGKLVPPIMYDSLSSGGVLSKAEKVEGVQYELYLSKPAMRSHGMVMFYFQFPTPILYPIPDHVGSPRDVPITGWHVLMSDIDQHTKVNKNL